MTLKLGDKAPSFKAPDHTGALRELKDYKGEWLLLWFYPKALTPGCTTEGCKLRDEHAKFRRRKAQVLGVSADAVAKQAKFVAKHEFPYPLLSDEDKSVCHAYGVWGEKKFMGRKYMGIHRVSFLIDPQGKIAKIYDTVKPAEHAAEVLADLARLQ